MPTDTLDPIRLFATAERDPYADFDAWRARGPVVWDEQLKGWLVLSHALCKQVLIDEDRFAHNYAQIDDDTLEIKGGRNLVVMQGAEHDRLHRWAALLFSPKHVQAYLQHHVQPVIDALFSRFEQRGHADLRAELCNPVPGRTMMSLMGMPWGDEAAVQRMVELHETIMAYLGKTRRGASDDDIRQAKAASHALNDILLPVIRDRRAHPGDDLLSRLWAEAPAILPEFDETLMLANAREFFLGGFDTTVHALSNGLYLLLTQPAVRAAVQADRTQALDHFIEETLRVLGVVQNRTRIATVDITLGEQAIRQGDVVIPVLYAANRDPAKYGACPAQVDLQRPNPRDHLAFIAGRRTCPGAPLARAEMRAVFEAVLDRLPQVRLDPAAEPPVYRGGFTRSYRPLQVVFDTASRRV